MAAKRILTTRATAHMVIADDIYTTDDKLIIPQNTVLTDEIIAALKEYSVFAIRVLVEDADGKTPVIREESTPESEEQVSAPEGLDVPPLEDTIPEEPVVPVEEEEREHYYAKVRETREFKEFHSAFMDSVDHLKETFNSVVMKNEEIDSDMILADVQGVVSRSRNSIHILDMLQCMRGYNDVTYVHSMNVALLSNMIGRIVYPDIGKEDLEVLTLAGMLHDIGKILIPDEIIGKKGHLTISEYNLVKTHVLHGNNILKNLNLDPRIAEVAMRHHERCDGSGYPGGYRRDQIEEFARIVAIADTYDAMTSDRVYRAAICPFEVIHMFEREGLVKYDVKFLLPFLETAVQAYMNTEVHLTTDEIGKVVMINSRELSRPIVQVGDRFYDLTSDHSIGIDKIMDD